MRARLPRILLSSLLMGAAVWGLALLLRAPLADGGLMQLVALAVLVGVGMAVYGLACLVTRAASPAELRAVLRRQRGTPSS